VEILAVLVGADNAVDNGPADLVVDGLLLVRGGRDEELQRSAMFSPGRETTDLILNVDKVACVFDGLDVGVGNRVLGIDTHGPLAAADQLAQSVARRRGSVPSGQLDMGSLALTLRTVMFLLLLVSHEAVEVLRETAVQPAKVLLAVAQQVVRRAAVRVGRLEQLILADIPGGVLFVEDEVPGRG
jgi:hypothetical protein